jgi:dethiobiotin synthetase
MVESIWNTHRLFVTGTDTGIGKTILSLLLMQYFYARGQDPFYLKLIQTGCRTPYDLDSDARFIYEHTSELKGKDPQDSVVYCFSNPKAPYFAARDEGRDIDLQVITEFVARKDLSNSPLIVEGAGGLLVPVRDNILMVDLIKMLGAQPIITARAGLGTINHTLLSIEVLRARGMEPLGVVFMDSTETGTEPKMISENVEAVERYSGIRAAGVVGIIVDFLHPAKDCYQPLVALFEAR